ncbi:MAG: RnfABCDGE type electron transport complex subunit D [Candidatus Faecousia sp.]|nr:RnfABCDGE type electron transport complex subunit D [Clostridiales bacterium]MDY6180613.1 RnfABCDGE type electron transport complex subunit D [Candidatus Faecousia sp.]
MNLTVASSPHIRGDFKTSRLMLDVVVALLPALAVGTWVLGFRALAVTAVSMVSAVGAEWLYCKAAGKQNTLRDCSALVTGMLLALTLPASVPFGIVVLGSVFAIVFAKCMCGGLGQNILNPALAARAFLMLLFPAALTHYEVVDGVSSATPLHRMVMPALPENSLMDMFLGRIPGSIGELSALALLLGGVFLVARKVISPKIPLAYLGSVAVLTMIFSKTGNPFGWMLYSLLGGGVMLGAIFMATDYATSPVTPMGQILYGIGCGALTVFFRYFGLFPEGVTYAILLMNLATWAIDRFTAPRRFGVKKGERV